LSTIFPHSDALHRCFDRSPRGVVGLADDLLRLCADQRLELDWRGDRLRVWSADGWEEVVADPLPGPIFRALLARLAAVGNEQAPGSASPYEGQFEWSGGNEPLRVTFVNRPGEHRLNLTPLAASRIA
jgi:hypothetical protein